ncbi:hypothetical protein AGOR_G00076810 [Albula goreensis]|uniref:Transmembrane protein PVRIG immunoglobulin-like domain-containing protein n=1 Tax=Albula goreensis TaxID=1534307 RepID=A0A8T3DSI0_9TELE|nr:hypothetical protein AGOR_G00076810 [Albula goreensis]
MRKGSTFVLLALSLLQTGRSNSRISVSQTLEDGVLTVKCDLLSEDRVSQINWAGISGNNHTNLGILHPEFGKHISTGHEEDVDMQASSSHHTTSLRLLKPDIGNSSLYCCLFITFPSGNLQACANSSSIITSAEPPESEAYLQAVTEGRWMVVGGLTALVLTLTLIVTFYLCRRYHGRRTQVFQVEQAFLTDHQINSEGSTAVLAQSSPQQEPTEAFDPSKLYAKIKIDYYYGRLWKAYESTTRGWTVGPQPSPRKIYYLLGEHPPPQKDNEKPQQD